MGCWRGNKTSRKLHIDSDAVVGYVAPILSEKIGGPRLSTVNLSQKRGDSTSYSKWVFQAHYSSHCLAALQRPKGVLR